MPSGTGREGEPGGRLARDRRWTERGLKPPHRPASRLASDSDSWSGRSHLLLGAHGRGLAESLSRVEMGWYIGRTR